MNEKNFEREVGRAPRAASNSAHHKRSKKQRSNYSTFSNSNRALGNRSAVFGADVPCARMIRMLSAGSSTAEEDQVNRILDAGAKKLFESEEGREKIRDGSFNNEETAKTMLEAAKEALEVGEGAESSGDSSKAKVREVKKMVLD